MFCARKEINQHKGCTNTSRRTIDPMKREYDVAIAGAGVLGLAHAYHLARRGLRVIVFERHPRASGASIRNFGMLWPIGQPQGPLYELARRSLQHWLYVLRESNLWHDPCG